MLITTNRIKVDFDVDAINRDFAFLRLERQDKGKNWYGAALLDSFLGDDFNAAAVLYRYGKYAYVMFRRPVDLYSLQARIRSHQSFADFHDGAVCGVNARSLRDEEEGAICEAWLLQILLNGLAASRSDKYPELNYCNLTGKLILMENLSRRKKDSLKAAEITVTTDYLLQVSISLFRKTVSVLTEKKYVRDEDRRRTLDNILSRPRYAIHGGRGVMRRVLPVEESGEDPTKTYIQCGEYGRRAEAPFLDFTGSSAFASSRGGIYHQILQRAGEELSDYAAINLVPRRVDEARSFSGWRLNGEKGLKGLKAMAADVPFHIVDCVRTWDSREIVSNLKGQLFPGYAEIPVSEGDGEVEGALNFRIVRNAAYYRERGEEDPYVPFDGRVVRQHLTVEDIMDEKGEISPPAVKTMVKEALIKRDLTRGRISLFDWSSFNFKKDWVFGIEAETTGRGIRRRLDSARFVKIRSCGAFVIHTVQAGLSAESEYDRYIEAMQEAIANSGYTNSEFEGLVACCGHINCISRTGEISLPDLDGIAEIMGQTGSED